MDHQGILEGLGTFQAPAVWSVLLLIAINLLFTIIKIVLDALSRNEKQKELLRHVEILREDSLRRQEFDKSLTLTIKELSYNIREQGQAIQEQTTVLKGFETLLQTIFFSGKRMIKDHV